MDAGRLGVHYTARALRAAESMVAYFEGARVFVHVDCVASTVCGASCV